MWKCIHRYWSTQSTVRRGSIWQSTHVSRPTLHQNTSEHHNSPIHRYTSDRSHSTEVPVRCDSVQTCYRHTVNARVLWHRKYRPNNATLPPTVRAVTV